MAEYRHRVTGEIKTQGEWRKANPNMSLPRTWNENVHDALNVDPVIPSGVRSEDVGPYQKPVRNGAVQNSDGNWVQAWEVVDLFEDYTNDDGVLVTKKEQEATYQQGVDNNAAAVNRLERDNRMAETDWWASSDLTMTTEQTAYRQALRDITTHSNWPHLEVDDWPTKP